MKKPWCFRLGPLVENLHILHETKVCPPLACQAVSCRIWCLELLLYYVMLPRMQKVYNQYTPYTCSSFTLLTSHNSTPVLDDLLPVI